MVRYLNYFIVLLLCFFSLSIRHALARRSSRTKPVQPVSVPSPVVVGQLPQPTDQQISLGIPPCPPSLHSATQYHPLFNPGYVDPQGRNTGCHYDHEHRDDPSVLNHLFGLPGQFFGSPGSSISYPWQTTDPSHGNENESKHKGYMSIIRPNLVCRPQFDAQGCFTDIRLQIHALPNSHDATVRFHSFSIESRACIGSQCGTIQTGGWLDFGRLESPDGHYIPLASDPPDASSANRPVRIHDSLDIPSSRNQDATWYSKFPIIQPAIRFPTWGPVNSQDPYSVQSHCQLLGLSPNQCSANGTEFIEMHLLTMFLDSSHDLLDGHQDGLVNFSGYRDRYGQPVSNCSLSSLDCIPLTIKNLPVGYYQYRDDGQGYQLHPYDTSPAATGRGNDWWVDYSM